MSKPYKQCPKCGSNLDHGEACDCEKLKEAASEAGQEAALPVTKEEREPVLMYGA